ncbi:hypothetical protein O6H91_03G047900 [Diphasiastrum complanatum]|uniref:Uncharacterized protein n=2 Tax=Diphasiastrum complanatum TaxID=34168 RepID=A0ACC2E6A9_DIPCM|nr:hypothetical protein O6H91_03G047900 [Diphasiastrum complanatum]KAJ7561923.1 hypothetical protein O6H91_03G047900 [Diphasiastrum complanatum]
MTAGERYLERQAELAKKEWLQSLPPELFRCFEVEGIPLRDAAAVFNQYLEQILRIHPSSEENQDDIVENSLHVGKAVFSVTDLDYFNPGIRRFHARQCYSATVIGSSQQGKTTLLNSLLGLFGFSYGEKTFYPNIDLLPTQSKDRIGLPFPLRLEYGPKYEVLMEMWEEKELKQIMTRVAYKKLQENHEFFEDVESGFITTSVGSFLEFLCKHGELNEQEEYIPSSNLKVAAHATGETISHDFMPVVAINPSFAAHEAVRGFFLSLLEDGSWFLYKSITLKCPSVLLQRIKRGSEHLDHAYILDLPGTGIVDDNNLYVEEMVLKDVKVADTIIILTGERSFTQDLLHILEHCIFWRLLDPSTTVPPAIAVTNSRHLRGLRQEEMEEWRNATIYGNLGWDREIKRFASQMFASSERDFKTLTPELFPNDLAGFLDTRGQVDVGVSKLIGYFLALPQRALLAYVRDVYEKVIRVQTMVDELCHAQKHILASRQPSRLAKEVKHLQKEEFRKALDDAFTLSSQKAMFGFEYKSVEGHKTIEMQLAFIDSLFKQQLKKLASKFEQIKDDKVKLKHETVQLLKEALRAVALQWDEEVGRPAFDQFLLYGRKKAQDLLRSFSRKAFMIDSKGTDSVVEREGAYSLVTRLMEDCIGKSLGCPPLQCTFTHAFRQQVWNLDIVEVLNVLNVLNVRRGRSGNTAYNAIWAQIGSLYKAKWSLFREMMHAVLLLQSSSIKELVARVKKEIENTFEKCLSDFKMVTQALEGVSKGATMCFKDPIVVLCAELKDLSEKLRMYIDKHKKLQDHFGVEELGRLVQDRFSNAENAADGYKAKRLRTA